MGDLFKPIAIRYVRKRLRRFRQLDRRTQNRLYREALKVEFNPAVIVVYGCVIVILPFVVAIIVDRMVSETSISEEVTSVTFIALVVVAVLLSWRFMVSGRVATVRRRLVYTMCHRCRCRLDAASGRDGWIICPECGLDIPGPSFDGQPSPIDEARAVG